MTVWFVPVHDAATVLRVDSEVDRRMNVATVRYSSRLDSLEDDVEVVLAHSKTIVNHWKGVGPFVKVESQSIVHVYGGERPYTCSDHGTPSSSANKRYRSSCSGWWTVITTCPLGSEVVRAPCLRQKEQVSARSESSARLQRELEVAAVAAPGERRFTSGRIAAAHRAPRSGPCASTPTGSERPRASSRPDRRRRPRSTAGRTRGTPPADRGP